MTVTITRPFWLALAFVVALVPRPAAAQSGNESIKAAATRLLGPTFTATQIESVAFVLEQQITTFPVGTSSGGFSVRFNPATGGLSLKTQSFGPLFAERATTLGEQGTFALGLSAQSTRFSSYEGRRLRNGELVSRTVFNGQLIDVNRFTFDAQIRTINVVANYAADTHVDVGVIVPIVTTSLSGTSNVLSLDTLQRREQTVDVAQTGLGDIVVRGKWNMLDRPHGGLAAVLDVSLPTGSEERFSSTGAFRIRPQFVASVEGGAFSPHVNIGYTFGGDGVQVRDDGVTLPVIERAEASDEFNYAVGADVSPHPSLTVFADLIGRTYRSVVRFDHGTRLVVAPGLGALPVETFVARAGTLNTRLGAIGAKTTVFNKGLISAALLFPLNQGGLRPGLTPMVGFEYTF